MLKQGLTATQLADTLEPGCSHASATHSKKGDHQGRSSDTQEARMVRQDPSSLRQFRPPLNRGASVQNNPRGQKDKEVTQRRPKAEKGSVHYVPISADFADDAPGGKHDKRLRHMAGAQKKVYRRALLDGKPVDVAFNISKRRGDLPASNRGSQPDPRVAREDRQPNKRVLSNDSTEDPTVKFSRGEHGGTPARQPGARPHRPARNLAEEDKSTEVGSTRMAIMLTNYPAELLKDNQMKDIEDFISLQACKEVNGKIYLDSIKRSAGFILIQVADDDSAQWVRRTVWKACNKLGMSIKSVTGVDIPKPTLITMYLPRAENLSKEQILKAIENSNDLDTKRWHVVREELPKKGNGKTMKILVDDHERGKLVKAEGIIRFLFSKVKVYGLHGKEDHPADSNKAVEPQPGEEPTEMGEAPAELEEEMEIEAGSETSQDEEDEEQTPIHEGPPSSQDGSIGTKEENDLLEESEGGTHVGASSTGDV